VSRDPADIDCTREGMRKPRTASPGGRKGGKGAKYLL
jgi:hypothetical protein